MGVRSANPFTNTIPHISRRALATVPNGHIGLHVQDIQRSQWHQHLITHSPSNPIPTALIARTDNTTKPDANALRLMGVRSANPFTNTIPHISRRALAHGSHPPITVNFPNGSKPLFNAPADSQLPFFIESNLPRHPLPDPRTLLTDKCTYAHYSK